MGRDEVYKGATGSNGAPHGHHMSKAWVLHALLEGLVKMPHLRGVSLMKSLLEQVPSLRVKAPPPGGIFMKKTPPYEGVLSAENSKKAETSVTQAEKADERGRKCQEVNRRAERGQNDSLVLSNASNTSTDLS